MAKALAATSSSIDTLRAADRRYRAHRDESVPLLGSGAGRPAAGHFDDNGFPAGKGWDEVALPSASDEHDYALEISGDQMKPAYRDGDVIVVSPGTPLIRRGDRVVVKTRGGEVMIRN